MNTRTELVQLIAASKRLKRDNRPTDSLDAEIRDIKKQMVGRAKEHLLMEQFKETIREAYGHKQHVH